ncbi:MAG: hypothetical protein RL329_1709, partial [Bacteroidota bacterium]
NFGGKKELAIRLLGGMAVPFEDTKVDGIPFLKQFHIGGPNSIRAWRIRGIGPGNTPEAKSATTQYQTGDIKLEANVEWRFPLFWRIESAVFLDMGNVWTIKKPSDNLSIKPHFTRQFYKDIAVGSGFALRFDFSYVLLRIDLGYKLRYPYAFDEIDKERRWNTSLKREHLNWNFGLGLPF